MGLELLLIGRGYVVDLASDGAEALDRVAEHVPHVVIVDLAGHPSGAWQAIQFLKADPRTRRIPVLLIIGEVEPDDLARARLVGPNELMVQPVDPEAVVRRTRDILRVRKLLG